MTRLLRARLMAAGCLLLMLSPLAVSRPASAQEFVAVQGALADEDFYRVVACAAHPGGECRKPFLRWSAARRGNLTVGLVGPAGQARVRPAQVFEAGLDAALREINDLDVGLRLRRTDAIPDIAIYVVSTAPGRVMRQTGVAELDGVRLPLARVSIRTRSGEIRKASIAISARARHGEVASLLLEEIVQGLGLITDIRGAAYRRSIFAEDSNSAVRLEGQDAMALRRHYGGATRYASLDASALPGRKAEVPPSVRLRMNGSTRGR